jgi:hypothetical protein
VVKQSKPNYKYSPNFLLANWFNKNYLDEEACAQAQNYTCVTNCPENSPDRTVDCGQELRNRLSTNDRIVSGSCTQSTNGCRGNITACNTESGVTVTLSVELDCPPPTPTPTPVEEMGHHTGGGIDCSLCTDAEDNDFDGQTDFNDLGCTTCNPSPIVIDISGNGFNLTNNANGVRFDLNCSYGKEQLSWTAADSDDAWLVLDRNGNGSIDNGRELFGNYTAQPDSAELNGFLALAEFDKTQNGGNNDGVIDNKDSIFTSLRLWQDANHNGISEANELKTLSALNVETIELDYKASKRTDEHGNQFKYRAKVWDGKKSKVGRWAWDVFLLQQPQN